MQVFASEPWVQSLGWTLVHFLWQGLVIAILYAAIRRGWTRKLDARARYLLACAAMMAMIAAPLMTWGLLRTRRGSPDASYRVQDIARLASTTGGATARMTLPASVRSTIPSAEPSQFLPWVVMVWLAGTLVFSTRLAGGWVIAVRMRWVLVRAAPPEWQDNLRALGARIGLSRPVRLLVSALVQAPTVVGSLRPVVLVPVGALSGFPPEHVEALLLHELAHIWRRDYLVNILQSIAEALLFYHPAVWWVSGHIRAERELCCDDAVVSLTGDPLTYARALAQLESHRRAHLTAAVAASGGFLSRRIARLLGRRQPAATPGLAPGVMVIAILLAGAGFGLSSHSKAQPSFQSVSIKRDTSDWSERFQHRMGLGANSSLKLMIQFAYAVYDSPYRGHSRPLLASQVIGGPAWIDSEGYDIDVKAAGDPGWKQKQLMWQKLLVDRFKLRLHRETREVPVYLLTPAKNGFRLPPPKEAGCVSFPLDGAMPRHVPGKVDCGYVAGPIGAGSGVLQLEGSKVHMVDLIRELSAVMDRPIFDRTGFPGEFDLNLRFTADESTRGLPPRRGPGTPANYKLPNIFLALEQQLGLKLVPSRGPAEVLIIDHAERPVTN
jgi:uncharacterized protein (TIGR03435 family)